MSSKWSETLIEAKMREMREALDNINAMGQSADAISVSDSTLRQLALKELERIYKRDIGDGPSGLLVNFGKTVERILSGPPPAKEWGGRRVDFAGMTENTEPEFLMGL